MNEPDNKKLIIKKRIIKKGDKIIKEEELNEPDDKNKDIIIKKDDKIIKDENMEEKPKKEDKIKKIMKKIIKGNKIIKQMINREKEGDNKKDIIISSIEEIIEEKDKDKDKDKGKNKRKRKNKNKNKKSNLENEEFEETIIEEEEEEYRDPNGGIKIRIIRRIIKGNNITEQIIEKEGDGDNAKEIIISEKKDILTDKDKINFEQVPENEEIIKEEIIDNDIANK